MSECEEQNYQVDTFPADSPQRQFVNDLRKIYVTYKRCQGLYVMLIECFEKSQDPFFASLSIAYNSFDYYQCKASSLTYTVLEVFSTWIQPKMANYQHLLTRNIKMNAFKVASGQTNKTISLLIINTYQLKTNNCIFIDNIRDMLAQHKYKEVCVLVKLLSIEDNFSINDFLVPLFLQDRLLFIDEFLIDNNQYQMAFITFLDSLVVEHNLSSRISKLISDLNMPDLPINTLRKLGNIKSLTKYIKKLLNQFNLPKDLAPNFSKRSEMKTASYLVHQRFSENALTDEIFRELVIDFVKDDHDVAKEFLLKLSQVGAYSEILYWCDVLSVPESEIPEPARKYKQDLTSGEPDKSLEEVVEEDWEEVVVEDYHTLLLPSSAVSFISTEKQLLSFLDEDFLNGCTQITSVKTNLSKLEISKNPKPDKPIKIDIPLNKDVKEVEHKEEINLNPPNNKSLLSGGASLISGAASIVQGGASIVSGGVNLMSGTAHMVCSGASVVSGGASLVSTGVSLATGRASLVRTGASILTGGASIASGSSSLVTSGVSLVSGTASIVSGGVSLVSGSASVVTGAATLVAGGVAKAISQRSKPLPNPTESYLFPKATLRGPGNSFIVALDCEWKPCSLKNKTELSLLQLATPSRVYILDMIALTSCKNHWDNIATNLFNNQDVLKIGFSMPIDLMYLSSYFGCDFENFGCNLLDLSDLWSKLTSEYKFQFPFTDESQENSESLSRLVFLCLGKYLDKRERFSNWKLRPLRESQIQYAAIDAFCLVEVYNVIRHLCVERELPFDDIVNEVVLGYKDKIKKKKKKQEEGTNNPVENELKVLFDKPISVDRVGLICNVTGLVKELRKCGISVDLVDSKATTQELMKKALTEDKYILIRGPTYKKLVESLPPNQVYRIKSTNTYSQCMEVLNYFNFIIREEDIFSRCLACNSVYMTKCSKEDVISWQNNPMVEVQQPINGQNYAPAGYEDDTCHDDYDDYFDDYDDDVPSQQPIFKPITTKYGSPIQIDVPDSVLKRVNSYYLCESCGKIFWKEGEFDQMLGTLNSS